MICSRCKNEKWDKDICPTCGLSEREALLAKAEEFRESGKNLLAAEYFQKYLRLQPGHTDALRKMSTCLCLEAISSHDGSLFDRANQALEQAVEGDWEWEKGHQLRVDLFLCFGRLDILLKEYEQIRQKDESRKNICDSIIKIIQLAEKFKENPPAASTNLTHDGVLSPFLKKFWLLLLGIPVLLWAIYKTATLFDTKDEKRIYFMFFLFSVLGFMVLVLFFVNMNSYRKNNKTKKEMENKID